MIMELRLKKGVYLVTAQASFQDYSTASSILEFHIDPPAEESTTFLMHCAVGVIVLVGVAGLVLYRRRINSLFRSAVR